MNENKIGKNTSIAALKKRALENEKRAEVDTSTPKPEVDEKETPPEKTA